MSCYIIETPPDPPAKGSPIHISDRLPLERLMVEGVKKIPHDEALRILRRGAT